MATTYPEATEVLIDGVTVGANSSTSSQPFSFPDNTLIVKAELFVEVASWATSPGAEETAVVVLKAQKSVGEGAAEFIVWGGGYRYKPATSGRERITIPLGQLPKHIVVTWGNETEVATGSGAVTVTLKYQYVDTT